MAVPFFLFVALPVLGVVALLWCYFCYKIGSWLVEGLFPRRRRPVYADVPVRDRYQPPQPPPAPPRPVRSCRRGGGGGAFFTLLVVIGVVLFCRSFTHRTQIKQVAQNAREQARAQARIAKAQAKRFKRSQPPSPPGVSTAPVPPPVAVEPPDVVVVADASEEILKAPELPPEEQKSGWVSALGRSVDEAEQNAQDKAYDAALAYLHEHLPGVQWTPPRSYVKEKLVKEFKPLPSQELEREIDGRKYANQAAVRLQVTATDLQDIIRHDRDDRVEQRMALLAKVLGVAVLLCAAVAAYVRIDEFSKGYLTGWLRLAGIVTAAAAGLFFFMR